MSTEIETEKKSVVLKIDGGKLIIVVDPNKDGDALLVVSVDLAEVPDEVIEVFKRGKN